MKPVARYTTLMHLTLLFAAASIAVAKPLTTECSLSKIAVASGMTRTEVEVRVAKAVGTPSDYSTYVNNLTGGTVEYLQAQCVLEVKYNAGAPAPLISMPQGKVQHLPPKDETVSSYKLHVVPLPPKTR